MDTYNVFIIFSNCFRGNDSFLKLKYVSAITLLYVLETIKGRNYSRNTVLWQVDGTTISIEPIEFELIFFNNFDTTILAQRPLTIIREVLK